MKTFLIIAATLALSGCTEVDQHQGAPYVFAMLALFTGFMVGGLGGREKV